MKTLLNNYSETLMCVESNRETPFIGINPVNLMAILALSVLMGFSTPSSAELAVQVATNTDGKTYSGAMCIPEHGDETEMNSRGYMYNTSFHDQIWTCPIVRDVMKGQNNGISTAVVKFVENHTRKNISCTIKSMTPFIGRVAQQSDDSRDGIIAFQGIRSYANGHYVMRCRVPAMQGATRKSGILFYRINEKL